MNPACDNIYLPQLARLERVVDDIADVKTFYWRFLEAAEQEKFRRFRPGQFAQVSLFGIGEFPTSLPPSPTEAETFFTVRRVGSCTAALHDLQPGDQIGVRGAYGTGFPMEDYYGKNLVFDAGGIGLIPLRSCIVYALAHRECYRGHAMNLRPNTTYYVRAFATNGVGIRYSDEEKTVTTLNPANSPNNIGPLCTDFFSNNAYLYEHFSYESNDTASTFIGYSPTCVLAKLIAYYRPAKFVGSSPGSKSKSGPINFNNLNWNPDADDFPMRLDEIRKFFGAIYDPSRQLGLHADRLGKDFLKNLAQLTGVKSKPVLTDFNAIYTHEAVDLIQQELRLSRPVIIMYNYNSTEVSDHCRWALIDGINSKGELHVDFPLHSTLGQQKPTTGYYTPISLIFKFYKASLITSLHY